MAGNVTISASRGELLHSLAGGICQRLAAPASSPGRELAFDLLGALVIGFGVGVFNFVVENSMYAICKGLENRKVIRRICPSIAGGFLVFQCFCYLKEKAIINTQLLTCLTH